VKLISFIDYNCFRGHGVFIIRRGLLFADFADWRKFYGQLEFEPDQINLFWRDLLREVLFSKKVCEVENLRKDG